MEGYKTAVAFVAGAFLICLFMVDWQDKHERNVNIDYHVAERYVPSTNETEWYIVYHLSNHEREKEITMLRFVCDGATKSQFELQTIPPGGILDGRLKLMNVGNDLDANSCKAEYKADNY